MRGFWAKVGIGVLLLVTAVLLPGRVAIWIDEHGRATLSNRLEPPTAGAMELAPEDLRLRWGGKLEGEPLRMSADSSSEEDRFTRELLAARDDIRRGETRDGLRRLRRLHRENPSRPEPAWLLAQVERQRGRLAPAREALDSALSLAAQMPPEWRAAAEALRGEIDSELAHAQQAYVDGTPIQVQQTGHFRVSYDHQFAGRQFGDRVLEMLAKVRGQMSQAIGRQLARTLEVRLYTKAQYLESYKHRFGFATVGFYDGMIHVVAARHPRNDLYALLIHEYAHALFEDALGSHQPFFLNEGIADGAEEHARGRGELSRGEWRQLLDAIRGKTWIRLGSIVRGFGGLEGREALLAYLESRAAIELIEDRHPGAVARWLARCADGESWEPALLAETGWDTVALEAELIHEVRSRFPADPLGGGLQLGEEPPASPQAPSSRSRPGAPASTPPDDRRAASRAGARAPA